MASDNSIETAIYRYFTVDLMSNETLMEIPFGSVTWERALRAGGEFSGEIPVIEATKSLNLYETTMPGQTALYVIRDNECVWGGIIWARDYNVKSQVLSVSASEFTSYFYHRKIWKTVNYQFSTSLRVVNGRIDGVLDTEESSGLSAGSSVQLEFYEPENFRYNGYYKILPSPAPTNKTFSTSANASADLIKISRTAGVVTIQTDSSHGFSSDDIVTLSGTTVDGTYTIQAPSGSASTYFTFKSPGADISEREISGTALRPILDGSYTQVTVTVRTDTYDYIRGLVSSVFEDFMGIDFANDYLRPGIETQLNVINKRLSQGFATIKTSTPHNLAVGQAVVVRDVDPRFDGEFEVVQTPDTTTFMYEKGGSVTSEMVRSAESTIITRSLVSNVATVTTSAPHGYRVGQTVSVQGGNDFDGLSSIFTGTFTIAEVGSANTFSYYVSSSVSAPDPRTLPNPRVVHSSKGSFPVSARQLSSGTATLTTDSPHTLAVGDSVTVADVDVASPISQIAYDAPNLTSRYTTNTPHYLASGDTFYLNGARDYSTPEYTKIESSVGQSTVIVRRNLYASPSGFVASTLASSFGPALTVSANSTAGTFVSPTAAANTGEVGLVPETFKITNDNSYIGKLLPNTIYTFSGYFKGSAGYGVTLTVGDGAAIYERPTVEQIEASKNDWTFMYITFQPKKGSPTSSGAGYGTTRPRVVNASNIPASSGMTISYKQVQIESTLSFNAKPTPYFAAASSSQGIYSYGTRTVPLALNTTWGPYLVSNLYQAELTSGYTADVTIGTARNHKFFTGDAVYINNVIDSYTPVSYSITNNVATVSLNSSHNIGLGTSTTISDVTEKFSVLSKRLAENQATFSLNRVHPFNVNDSVTITGLSENASIVSKEIQDGVVILVTSNEHNIQPSQEITVSGVGAPYDSVPDQSIIVLETTKTRILYRLQDSAGNDLSGINASATKASGNVSSADSVFNGTYVIVGVPSSSSIQVGLVANDIPTTGVSGVMEGNSPINGTYQITGVPSTQVIQFSRVYGNVASTQVAAPANDTVAAPSVSVLSFLNRQITPSRVTNDSVTFKLDVQALRAQYATASGTLYRYVTGNGEYSTVSTVPNSKALAVTEPASTRTSAAETNQLSTVYLANDTIFNRAATVTWVSADKLSFAYAVPGARPTIPFGSISGYGKAIVQPSAIVGTFGSFPGNTDIGIDFSTKTYSGKNVQPTAYRGHELTTVGDALDAYAGSTDGFDYRIDCRYDQDQNRFVRTFVLIPIDFPNPPAAGEVSPPSRFGADKLVFEYPGNVSEVKMEESAENSATRFFVVGDADLGEGAANPFSAASAIDLLNSKNTRKWPILDEAESLSDISDETVLYAYAKQFLAESRPPEPEFTVSVNGSLQPEVGNYAPGNWCSVIVNDMFLQERLASSMEPRDSVLVRKIDSFKVKVPDGTTFPEVVTLKLIAEWDVDKRGDTTTTS